MPVLEPDTSIRLPGVTVLKASAGSGKTWTLTERYVQFLLSRAIPKNALRNILAITFSNNASREMKENVFLWLKSLCLREPGRTGAMCLIAAGGEEQVSARAAATIQEILRSYPDFQVRTIDSFMASVFRSSAVELGFGPELEIVLEPAPLIDYAFDLFLREARRGSASARLIERAVDSLAERKGDSDSFPWEPGSALRAELRELARHLANLESAPIVEEEEPRMRSLEEKIRAGLEEVDHLVRASGLEANRRSTFPDALSSARAGAFMGLIERGMKTPPVKKPARKEERQLAFERIEEAWGSVDALVGQYAAAAARAFYAPWLRLHGELSATLDRVKRSRGTVFLSDITRTLGTWLSRDIVPDVYFRLGERIFHYLIDEFQDTSPIQWQNLFPLVENSLAQDGSLFVVGDTKQAIYGFRQADYTIMRGMEEKNPFPSARHTVSELDVNYRSRPRILDFNRQVFREAAASLPQYREAARRSGLDSWEQRPNDPAKPGIVEVEVLPRDDAYPPERMKLHELLERLHARGVRWGDVAVLASRNEEVIRATAWLNEKQIPFLSFSSLDVRRRKLAGEILSLLTFLDSPKDDLAFVTFMLGDVFRASLAELPGSPSPDRLRAFLLSHAGESPLYKAFQDEFPGAWKAFFTGLFRSAGYLPLYDLVSEIYAVFQVFRRMPNEEATLAKLLETVKDFEGSGSNSLRDFLRFAADTETSGAWDIDVPQDADSVRVMTVHKAKGLGFPVVIVLLYGERGRGTGVTVLRGADGIRLVRLTQKLAQRDPELAALLQEEATKDTVNRLNALYVALTRAREEMYVIGVRRERDEFPFDLLPETGFSAEDSSAASPALPVPSAGQPEERAATLSHESRPLPSSVVRARRLARAERRRGDLVHAALAKISVAAPSLEEDIRRALSRTARELRVEEPEPGLAAAAARLIRTEPLAGLFDERPGRTVHTEWELCSAEGRIFRMDRVVVDDHRVAVIDWKTGSDEDEAGQHEAQISAYAALLRDMHPGKTVEAILAYVDRGEVRRVG